MDCYEGVFTIVFSKKPWLKDVYIHNRSNHLATQRRSKPCLSGDGTTVAERKPSRTLTSWLMSVTKVKEKKVVGKIIKGKMGKRNLTLHNTLLPKLEDKSSAVCCFQIVQWDDCDSTDSSRLERHAALYAPRKKQYYSSSALDFASITNHVQLRRTHEYRFALTTLVYHQGY